MRAVDLAGADIDAPWLLDGQSTLLMTFDQVLAVRAERVAMMSDFLAAVTPKQLEDRRRNPWAPDHTETVRSCLPGEPGAAGHGRHTRRVHAAPPQTRIVRGTFQATVFTGGCGPGNVPGNRFTGAL